MSDYLKYRIRINEVGYDHLFEGMDLLSHIKYLTTLKDKYEAYDVDVCLGYDPLVQGVVSYITRWEDEAEYEFRMATAPNKDNATILDEIKELNNKIQDLQNKLK